MLRTIGTFLFPRTLFHHLGIVYIFITNPHYFIWFSIESCLMLFRIHFLQFSISHHFSFLITSNILFTADCLSKNVYGIHIHWVLHSRLMMTITHYFWGQNCYAMLARVYYCSLLLRHNKLIFGETTPIDLHQIFREILSTLSLSWFWGSSRSIDWGHQTIL